MKRLGSLVSMAAGFAMVAASSLVAGGASAANIPHGGSITEIDAPISPFVRNFNPFSPAFAAASVSTTIYEPLLYFNSYTEQVVPKLATSYSYSNGGRVITLALRKGVKWSDGKSFTSADVVFTYQDILKNPGADLTGVSSDLQSVKAVGTYGVQFTLKKPNTPFLFYLVGDVPILPEHVWVGKNPVTWSCPNPVTTGPFTLGSVSSNQLVLARNPYYWDAPRPYVDKVIFPAYLSNETADLAMSQGKWDFAEQFIPDIQTALLSHNPKHFGYWFPEFSPAAVFLNNKVYPLSLRPFRQALAYAVNRQAISTIGEYGYETPLPNYMLPVATYSKWIPQSVQKKFPIVYSVVKAKAVLKAAGFKWSSSGQLISPKGQPVSLTLLAPSGATDYVSDIEIMARDFKAIGIQADVKVPAVNTEIADLASGSYQVGMMWTGSGPGPYFVYDSLFSSVFTAPIGKNAPSNYERFSNPTVDNLLNEFAATQNLSKEKAIMAQLETIIGTDVPILPAVGGAAWEEYNTTHDVGWPTAKNPFAAFDNQYDYQYNFAVVHKR